MLYPADAADSLDFTALKTMVGERAATPQARRRIEELQPEFSWEAQAEELERTDQMLTLYQQGHFLPAGATADTASALTLLRVREAVLSSEQFLALKAQTESYQNLYRFCGLHRASMPAVVQLLERTPPVDEVPLWIDKILERNGEVKTSASKELATIRNTLSRKRTAADRVFYKVLRRYESEGWLGDIRESVADDRRVLAVTASYKNRAQGAFHGSSSKQSLVFLEPGECLEINAEVALLREEETKEIRRILKALTAQLAPLREPLLASAERLIDLDFLNAKARFAFDEGACLPTIHRYGKGQDRRIPLAPVHLVHGINPVLRRVQAGRGKPVVPLQLTLGDPHRLVVISGPNAGGKSLALKTLGLFQLMLQSGLLVPVHPSSAFRWVEKILVDIGDAQSVENELSTYSAKLSKMKQLLVHAGPGSLCLVDEFGSGSDPDLGSALAQVFLKKLHESGTLGVFTTHYNAIKALAGSLAHATNANMAFDVKTFEPEYRLHVGSPGSSYTFEVAQRVGLPKALLAEAREALDGQTRSVDQLLVTLQRQRTTLDRTQNESGKRLRELEQLKADQEGRIAKLEDKLERVGSANAEVADRLAWGKRFESAAKLYAASKGPKARQEVMHEVVKLFAERAGRAKKDEKKAETKAQQAQRIRLEQLWAMPVNRGDKVRVLSGGRTPGELLEVKKDRYLVRLGNLSSWMDRQQFIPWNEKI